MYCYFISIKVSIFFLKKEETIKSLPFKDRIRLNLKLKMHMNKEFLKETFVDLEVKE